MAEIMRQLVRLGALLIAFSLTACLSDVEKTEWRDAALYVYGPYQYAQNIDRLRAENAAQGVGVNEVAHSTTLSDHTSRRVTTPNADTLYSSAVLNLSAGPVELILPDAPGRYVSVMVMDIFTDIIDLVGSWDDARGRRFWIVGPDWAGTPPDGVSVIRSPGIDAWLLGRIFVAGPSDLEDARTVQSGLQVRSVEPGVPSQPWSITIATPPNAENAVTVVNTLLGRAPDHPHTQRAATFANKGILPGAPDSWSELSRKDRLIWSKSFERVETALKTALSQQTLQGGWRQPPAHLAQFGEDDAVRSAVSLIGFGAMRAEDATYFSAETDAIGAPLSGAQDYTLTFDPDAVPVDAFWSISAYQIEPDGRRFFYDNPLGRHSINGDTPGLMRDAAGDLTLYLSSDAPDQTGNWLPLPDDGPVAIIFRTYRPQAAVLEGVWSPPDIMPVEPE